MAYPCRSTPHPLYLGRPRPLGLYPPRVRPSITSPGRTLSLSILHPLVANLLHSILFLFTHGSPGEYLLFSRFPHLRLCRTTRGATLSYGVRQRSLPHISLFDSYTSHSTSLILTKDHSPHPFCVTGTDNRSEEGKEFGISTSPTDSTRRLRNPIATPRLFFPPSLQHSSGFRAGFEFPPL